MGSIALAITCIACFMAAGLCGLLTWVILTSTPTPRLTAFGWGAALGPIGIIVAIVLVARAEKSAPVPVIELRDEVPW